MSWSFFSHRSRSLVLTLCLIASGCSLLGHKSESYLDARISPPLEIPADLDDSTISDLMAVPVATSTRNPLREDHGVPRPGQLLARGATDPVKIQKLGERRWLVVAEAPSSIWPKVVQFLADNGVGIQEERPSEGYLRSVDVSVSRSGRYRDAVRRIISESDQRARTVELRLEVEQGIHDGFTEVHMRYLYASPPPAVAWPGASSNSDVERALLLELGAYLKSDLDRVAFSIRGQEISARPKAWLTKEDDAGPPVLRLRLDYGRAWAMVVSAFANAEVNVTDADREKATMSVDMERVLLEGGSRGLFSFLGGGGEEELQIRFKPWREGFDVEVYQGEAPAPDELGQKVLVLIREYAS